MAELSEPFMIYRNATEAVCHSKTIPGFNEIKMFLVNQLRNLDPTPLIATGPSILMRKILKFKKIIDWQITFFNLFKFFVILEVDPVEMDQ